MKAFKIGAVSLLALATAAPSAFAQYYQPTEQYRRDLDRYNSERAAYDARSDDYRAARAEYDRRRAAWEASRIDYDRRYGYGAYVRRYGAAPVWVDARWRDYYATPSAAYYGRDTAYTASAPIRCDNNSTVTAGVLGAIAGAVLGSNVAARNARTEGAVLGAVVGGGVGAAVGHANDKYRCDARGPYFSYDDTVPYREASAYGTGRYSYYNRMRCRLAAAPVDSYGRDYRYVRVCPDGDGRYRISG